MIGKKIKLFIDADDTILKSSEAVIDILNNRYGTHKTINDMKDWGYRSIHGTVTEDEIISIYESFEFYDIVDVHEGFDKLIDDLGKYLDINIVTKGSKLNLQSKEYFFEDRYIDNGFKFIGLPLTNGYDKSGIDMSGGICIDDRVDCLQSCNANIKILILNNKYVPWANRYDCVGIENLYIVNTWEEIYDIVKFAINNKFFMEKLD